MSIPYMNLEHPGADCGMSGLGEAAYFIATKDLDTIAALPSAPVTTADHAIITDLHVPSSGKAFTKVYSTPEKAGMNFESEGEKDSKFFRTKGSFFYPSTSAEAMAMSKAVVNQRHILLVKPNDSDKYVQVGTAEHPCYIMPKGEWGTAYGDQKGITFEFEAVGCMPAYIYDGVVPPVPAV